MRRSGTVTTTFYVVLSALVAGVLLDVLPLVLPDALAGRIARNSEGLVLALILAAWIQFARPRVAVARRGSAWLLVAALGFLAAGLLLLATDLPSRFRTLNETFLAAAVVLPYLQVRRPLPRHAAPWIVAVVAAVVVVGNRTPLVTDLAETFGVLLLVPLAFDVVDRGILDPTAAVRPRARLAWYAVLVAAPVCFSLLEYRLGLDGVLGEVARYAVRITEAFVCLLLVELYLAVGLGRTGAAGSARVPERSARRPAASGARPPLG